MPVRLIALYQAPADPEECIDCGACEPECPVTAIFAEVATPDQCQNYIQINADYFVK